jgi:arginase family enzyme
MDVVEVNPGLGTAEDVEATAKNAVELVKSAFGSALL